MQYVLVDVVSSLFYLLLIRQEMVCSTKEKSIFVTFQVQKETG